MSRRAGLLVALALVHGLMWALLIPPWQAPDETAHFEYSNLLAQDRHALWNENASPELEQQIVTSLYQFRAWSYINARPPAKIPTRLADAQPFGRSRTLTRFSVSYVVYALAVSPFLNLDVAAQLYIMRLVSVSLGAVVVLLTFGTARLVAPKLPELAVGAALFVVFLPQHAFITASVNDGNLAEVLASAVIYLLVKMWLHGLTWQRIGLALTCGILASLAKATTYFLIPLTLIAGPAIALRWYGGTAGEWRQLRTWLAPAAAVLVCGAFLLVFPLLYLNRVSAGPQGIALSVSSNSKLLSDSFGWFASLNANGRFSHTLWGTFQSFWAYFGWMILPLPATWYWLLLGASALSVLGGVVAMARHSSQTTVSAYPILGLAAGLAVLVVLVWFVVSPIGLDFWQGRYLYGGISALAVLLVAGWLALVPPRLARPALWITVVAMVTLDWAALCMIVVPFFYGSISH